MWPLISSPRMNSACSAASSGESANFTPPAFMRPPVRTCHLMTTEPPISAAILRASSGVLAKPCGDTGIPAALTIWRLSSSKKRTSAPRGLGHEPVGLGQLGVLLGEHLGEADHHLALLEGGVVLHLAVEHVHAGAVGDRLDHALGELDLLRVRREDLLGDRDLARVQRPGADAAHQEGDRKSV